MHFFVDFKWQVLNYYNIYKLLQTCVNMLNHCSDLSLNEKVFKIDGPCSYKYITVLDVFILVSHPAPEACFNFGIHRDVCLLKLLKRVLIELLRTSTCLFLPNSSHFKILILISYSRGIWWENVPVGVTFKILIWVTVYPIFIEGPKYLET